MSRSSHASYSCRQLHDLLQISEHIPDVMRRPAFAEVGVVFVGPPPVQGCRQNSGVGASIGGRVTLLVLSSFFLSIFSLVPFPNVRKAP